MGVIKEGRVSGFIPDTEAFAVHFPGYPSSISSALHTLGGLQAIQKVRGQQSNKLELHFRPQDPYSHPTFGDLRPCNNLLLKISKTISKTNSASSDARISDAADSSSLRGGSNSGSTITNSTLASEPKCESVAPMEQVEDDGPNLCVDIVARVLEAYHFDGMVDYQHVVAVHADIARRKKRSWREVDELRSEKSDSLNFEEEDVMILVPPLFANKDVPESLVLKPSVTLSSKKNQEAVVQPDCEIDMEPVLAIDFNINEIPKRITWEDYIPQGSDQWEMQMAVSKLFDERPVWIKRSLNERLLDKGYNVVGHMLRRLLSRVAYYFSSGPFLRFWIKKGYDPRKDSDSRMYQRIDFRVHPSLRGYCDANTANQANQRWEDICAFRVFPFKCQTSLQLFELADDYIQQEMRKPPSQNTCASATGWFSNTVLDNFRQRIIARFLAVYPKPGAERLLKAATENFEKSKRRLSKDHATLHEEENPVMDTEVIGDVDVAQPNNVEVEVDEENEVESDEEAEDEISLPSDSHLNTESISRSHLMELFGSFPFAEAGGLCDQPQNADSSDEEYQILEQDSDGDDFSDDATSL